MTTWPLDYCFSKTSTFHVKVEVTFWEHVTIQHKKNIRQMWMCSVPLQTRNFMNPSYLLVRIGCFPHYYLLIRVHYPTALLFHRTIVSLQILNRQNMETNLDVL